MADTTHKSTGGSSHLPRDIGGYRIQSVIGSGGMATVYAALQANPKRTVALKVMKAADNAPEALRRFRREAQILARLRHPGIAQIYEAGTHTDEHGTDIPYFVMEFIPSPKTIIEHADAGQLDLRRRLRLFVKVCAAVEHGHHQKIIHRDLKPANILIDQSGQPKIIDFGIAHAAQLDVSHRTQQVDTNRLVGTIQYMAPEQLAGGSIDLDARCDVYALGAVLYRLLTGRPTHDVMGMPLHQAMQTIREKPVKPPGQVKRELRGDLNAVIEKALAKDRSHRYRNAGELGRDILRFLRDEPVQARAVSLPRRLQLFTRRHQAAVTAVITVIVVLVAAAAMIVFAPYFSDELRDVEPDSGASVPDTNTAQIDPPVDSQQRPPARQPVTIHTFAGQVNEILCHPDGLVAIASNDASVGVYDLNERTLRFTVQPDDEPVMHVAFNAVGDRLMAVTRTGLVALLDAQSGEVVRRITHPCQAINDFALAPGGAPVALSCEQFKVRVIDPDGPDRTLRSTSGAITSLAFSSNGAHLLGGSRGGWLYVWDVETGERARRIEAFEGGVIMVAWTDHGRSLLAVNDNGRASTWPLADGETTLPPAAEVDATDGMPVAIAVDPSGRWLAGASSDAVVICDLHAMQRVGGVHRHDGPLTAVGITSDGRWYIIGTLGGEVIAVPIDALDQDPDAP